MLQTLLIAPDASTQVERPKGFTGPLHLVDATHLWTWKQNGDTPRLHCRYDPFGTPLEQVTLTDHHVREGLRHFSFEPGVSWWATVLIVLARQSLIKAMWGGCPRPSSLGQCPTAAHACSDTL